MEPVPTEVVQQVAAYFSILSEPMRLKILNLLRDGEKCVQDLVVATATSQANVSKHLKVMLQAGILSRRTQGTSAFYSVSDDLTFELCTPSAVWRQFANHFLKQRRWGAREMGSQGW
jgi:DNA-binding transcriptional ArsR family regulator